MIFEVIFQWWWWTKTYKKNLSPKHLRLPLTVTYRVHSPFTLETPNYFQEKMALESEHWEAWYDEVCAKCSGFRTLHGFMTSHRENIVEISYVFAVGLNKMMAKKSSCHLKRHDYLVTSLQLALGVRGGARWKHFHNHYHRTQVHVPLCIMYHRKPEVVLMRILSSLVAPRAVTTQPTAVPPLTTKWVSWQLLGFSGVIDWPIIRI